MTRVLDALHKLCHDAMLQATGAHAVYFAPETLRGRAKLPALVAWSQELDRVARHAEHPWHEGLLIEALVKSGASALAAATPTAAAGSQGLDTLRR